MELIWLMFSHWFSDYCLQTEDQAKNKSSNFRKLIEHTSVYSLVMMICSLIIFTQKEAVWFGASCFIFHTITDYFSSKFSKIKYQKGQMNGLFGFWSIVGLDQFLHFVQIYLTYMLIAGGF